MIFDGVNVIIILEVVLTVLGENEIWHIWKLSGDKIILLPAKLPWPLVSDPIFPIKLDVVVAGLGLRIGFR